MPAEKPERSQPKSNAELEAHVESATKKLGEEDPRLLINIGRQAGREEAEQEIIKMKAAAEKDLQERREISHHFHTIELPEHTGIDELTGLLTRKRFEDLAAKEVALFLRQQQKGEGEPVPITFILVDLNDFKPINDTYSHAAGNEALKAMADFLKSQFKRASDLIARYGGDEFVLMVTGPLDQVHERLGMDNGAQYGKISLPDVVIHDGLTTNEIKITLSASVGLALYRHQGEETLDESVGRSIGEADASMYKAKGAGGRR